MTAVEDDLSAPASDRPPAHPAPILAAPRAAATVIALALIGMLGASPVVSLADRVLPLAARVRSHGTAFPTFATAEPFAVRATFLVIAIGVLAAVAAEHVTLRWRPTPRGISVVIGVVAIAAAVTYRWFGYPHNGLPTNSYLHWVDISYTRAHVQWYVLLKPVHHLFYDRPYLLQAINGALNVVLIAMIGRSMYQRRALVPAAMAAALLLSSLLLAFADTAEDVQLTVAALLFVTLAVLRRWTPWSGVGLFVVILARPPLAYIWGVWLLTELLVVDRSLVRGLVARVRHVLHDRFVVLNGATAVALFVVWDLILVARGENWLFHNGRLVDSVLVDIKPMSYDGFTISQFSGAYLLHALWVFPAIWLVALGVALWRRHELPLAAERAVVFSALAVAGAIAVSEVEPLGYYNVRYLTYVVPFLLIAAFAVPLLPPRRRAWLGPAGVTVCLLLAASTPYWTAFQTHDRLTGNTITRTFGARHELRHIVGDATVSTMLTDPTVQRYLAYIFHRPKGAIRLVSSISSIARGYVFAPADNLPRGRVVWRDGPLVLVRVPGR